MNHGLLRILFLADATFDDIPGGSRVVARELASGLSRRGHQVTFLVPRHKADSSADEFVNGVRIVRYDGAGKALRFVRAGRAAAAALLQNSKFDVAHTHFAYAGLGPLRAIPQSVARIRSFYGPWDQEGWVEDSGRFAVKHRLSRPIGWAAKHAKRTLRRKIEASSVRASDAIIVLSEQSRGEVAEFGCSDSKIYASQGGVDLARFTPPKDKQAVRHALGLPDNRRVLLSIRRLAPRMGLDRLVTAMREIVARHPDVLLLIGGKGPELGRLEAMISDLGLQSHVRLLGFIPDEQLASHYAAADLFVLPTTALEGFGLVTVEALACGVPVIGTPIGATPEILAPLDPHLVARDATSGALSESIIAFLNGGWAQSLSPDRLRQHVCENYSWDRHVDKVENLYYQVIDQKSQPK